MASSPNGEVHTYKWQIVRARVGQAIPPPMQPVWRNRQRRRRMGYNDLTPTAFGGTAHAGVGISHRSCNRRHGQAISEMPKALNRPDTVAGGYTAPPSQDW